MTKIVGMIGGMGPLATVKLFEKIVLLTDAKSDQEHLRILIDNNTSIPDRTDYILQRSSLNPKNQLIESAKKLESIGADFLIMPCNTAHYFYDDLANSVDIPFLNMIEETAKYIDENKDNLMTVGLISTAGTVEAKVYENVFNKYALSIINPSVQSQKKLTELINSVKAGKKYEDIASFNKVIKELNDKGAELIVVGCTELSVAVKLYKLEGNFIDALEILAINTIEYACN